MEKNVENFRAKLHYTIEPNSLSGRNRISEFMISPNILNFLNSLAKVEMVQERFINVNS